MNEIFRMSEYFEYLFTARGIGNMHSPFVYDFMKNVLYDRRHFYAYDQIEKRRQMLLSDDKKLQITDYGTGHASVKTMREIIKTSVKPSRQAQLLFRIASHYACKKIIEIGTSAGLTTLYLAAPDKSSHVITLEGDPVIAAAAKKNFQALETENIKVVEGNFDTTFPAALKEHGSSDLIFFDGNHRREATIAYFEWALSTSTERSIFIFDDIHWSREMRSAWATVQSNQQVRLTLDLFYLGIAFFRKELSKQHFILRF